jgi:hypothetical protein
MDIHLVLGEGGAGGLHAMQGSGTGQRTLPGVEGDMRGVRVQGLAHHIGIQRRRCVCINPHLSVGA